MNGVAGTCILPSEHSTSGGYVINSVVPKELQEPTGCMELKSWKSAVHIDSLADCQSFYDLHEQGNGFTSPAFNARLEVIF